MRTMEEHHFYVSVAKEVGVHAAILFYNITYWIRKNKANEANFRDGKWWTYNSVKAFQELFPYLTEKQIRTALKKLIDGGWIIVGEYNSSSFNHKKWYALTQKGEQFL